ncbi:MAG TPA: chromosomal replication initiator protein DnaA [Corynebacterium xerosis]|uniref:chromosomal replication initiator protein DnaA n=1 Tax=Corynebacterium xerosis TaxID=1725 RepID=UPI001D584609|nr:chromosomal replication initiator protein DnaA [Corynebacterium xerosis]HJG57469.1 chromosomal replication initiator protein DnaA [Corynebacterium xerosis]
MTTPSRDFHDTWLQVIDMLIAGTDVRDGEPQPLPIQHKALLRSVQPVGQVNGFVLLATGSEMVQTLVKEELSERIERALEAITGSAQQVVVTISEESGHDDQAGHSGTGQTGAGHAGHAGAPRHTVAGRESAQTAQSSQPSRHSQPGQATQSGHPDHRRHQDAGSWRTLEFERDARETAEFGDPAPQNTGHGSAVPAQRQPMQPQPPQNPATQGTAADLFGRGKYPLHDIGDPMGQPVEEPTLNPKYTFETFVIGPQNRFAAAAAAAVAEQPARAYNPLFISGGSGLGKTHLLHAIGHYATALDPKLRVRYVSSEEFTNDFINSVRDDAQESFKRRYRDLDILIVDDIQFLEGKEGTQEEFFHTFNALHQADRQIVLSSDRPPRELKTLEERLRTRFEWGLTPDLQLPDLETRIAILSKKAQLDRLNVPHDVLQFIAEHTASSIRELEGRLLQVTAQASLLKMPVSLQLAEEIIGSDSAEVEITPDIIISATAEFYGLTVADLTGPGKTRPVSHARQVAMYLTRSLIDISLPAIGKVFGNRDHSTVLYAHRKIQKEISDKRATKDQVNDLTTRIRERSRAIG